MILMKSTGRDTMGRRGGDLITLLVLTCVILWPAVVLALDICGCQDNPASLGAFDSADENTYPLFTLRNGNTITIPLPDDGVLIFDSFHVALSPEGGSATVNFEPNAKNTPVTLLVAGDMTIATGVLSVNGQGGSNGTWNNPGIGGLGGPGGFRGGDGAYQYINHGDNGGTGFGPGGGDAGTVSSVHAGNGQFVGVSELLPMIGGSGGGGGASPNADSGVSAGGGGGGGGAILIAVNGTLTVDGTIRANGGRRGVARAYSGAGYGGRGSGGAIRIVAQTITGGGDLYARPGDDSGSDGAIRIEAINNTFPPNNADPLATLVAAPGPIANPIAYSVSITEFNGLPVPEPPVGGVGEIDFTMASAGPANIALTTLNVPAGTTILVAVKPRFGGDPVEYSVTLNPGNCDGSGNCTASTAFNLDAGKYIIEAQATFQAP